MEKTHRVRATAWNSDMRPSNVRRETGSVMFRREWETSKHGAACIVSRERRDYMAENDDVKWIGEETVTRTADQATVHYFVHRVIGAAWTLVVEVMKR